MGAVCGTRRNGQLPGLVLFEQVQPYEGDAGNQPAQPRPQRRLDEMNFQGRELILQRLDFLGIKKPRAE